nr:MAG TPA: hypothetical protein [Bacteriophage sp.]
MVNSLPKSLDYDLLGLICQLLLLTSSLLLPSQ